MTLALLLVLVGGILVYAGWKDRNPVELLLGRLDAGGRP